MYKLWWWWWRWCQ